MQDLIFDKNISRYRQAELEEGAKIAVELLKGNYDPQYIKGSMEMLKKLLQLPLRWAKTDEAKEVAGNMITKELKEFHAKFVRMFVE